MTETGKNVVAAAGGALAGAVLFWGLSKLRHDDEEDRPPILVVNGSIRFSFEPTTGGHSIDWVRDGGIWKPDHPNGRRVRRFEATFRGAGAQHCQPMQGVLFKISFGSQTFQIHRHGHDEPAVAPATVLSHDPRSRSLSHGTPEEGMITAIEALPGKQSCNFSSRDVEIRIRPLH